MQMSFRGSPVRGYPPLMVPIFCLIGGFLTCSQHKERGDIGQEERKGEIHTVNMRKSYFWIAQG